ncbi:MAG: right-handed parallel beta-helix repeat-containing protein [Planctomycetota bacterium]
MTEKRRTKSNVVGESRQQLARVVLAGALGIVIAVGLGAGAITQAATITVNQDGSGDFADIPPAVAAAASGDTIEVAEGDYTGAVITQTVRIHGSGPGTLVKGNLPWGDTFAVYAAGGTEISNLTIESGGMWSLVIYADAADNFTVRDVTISGDHWSSMLAIESDNTVVSNNTILGGGPSTCIWLVNCPGSQVSGNTIEGPHGVGMDLNGCPNGIVSGNTISGTQGYAILMQRYSDYSTVTGNVIKDFDSNKAGRSPIYLSSSYCTFTDNKLINVYDPHNHAAGFGPRAGIYIRRGSANTLIGNDYSKSGLPGWNKKHPSGPGSVQLRESTNDNVVDENKFPPGTKVCEQVDDWTDSLETPEYDGLNEVVGWDRCPDIADRIRDAAEEEEEEEGPR